MGLTGRYGKTRQAGVGRNWTIILAQPNHELSENRIPTTKSNVMVEPIGHYSNLILQIGNFNCGTFNFEVA
jgi:hypothetical protein